MIPSHCEPIAAFYVARKQQQVGCQFPEAVRKHTNIQLSLRPLLGSFQCKLVISSKAQVDILVFAAKILVEKVLQS